MEPILLDDERRRFFDENGYLVVPGALCPEELGELTAAADRMIEGFARPLGQAYVQRRPGLVEEPAFHPLLAHSSTLPLVVQLLSPNLHLHTARRLGDDMIGLLVSVPSRRTASPADPAPAPAGTRWRGRG